MQNLTLVKVCNKLVSNVYLTYIYINKETIKQQTHKCNKPGCMVTSLTFGGEN